jgi:hypothetical protein
MTGPSGCENLKYNHGKKKKKKINVKDQVGYEDNGSNPLTEENKV